MNSALLKIDAQRTEISAVTERFHKEAHGQFMTPISVASFMASMMNVAHQAIHIVDPGAGIGSLTSALLHRVEGKSDQPGAPTRVKVTAIESDTRLLAHLWDNIGLYNFADSRVVEADFIEFAVNEIQFGGERFTHAIMNPPYKKIGSNSAYRKLGRLVGVETVNLYSLFVALTILLLKPGGELVAIIPRSFCNGPYYRPFRDMIFDNCAIERIHLFGSRKSVFSHDHVLQENIIIHLTKNGRQKDVVVSRSTDDTLSDLECTRCPFSSIVRPDDEERFLRIPASDDGLESKNFVSLAELGIRVSTGPVVDFRVKEFLSPDPKAGVVPLLYPAHFRSGAFSWPIKKFKKANAIVLCDETRKWMFPVGNYVLTRRFSSKEERRRVVANVLLEEQLSKYKFIGLENHFNVFHIAKSGMPRQLALGLAAYLNSKFFDHNFRQFSGHTQVNATDLRNMPYLKRNILESLGEWVSKGDKTEIDIEKRIAELV